MSSEDKDPLTRSTFTSQLETQLKEYAKRPEPDGAKLHCVAVSQICFKHGHITVPPSVVFACEGMATTPPKETGLASYSKVNPPPHWSRVMELRSPRFGGGSEKMGEFYKGKWRDEPEQWWQDALGGELESRRSSRTEKLVGLRRAMEEARNMHEA
jgi:hypothetical protein